ncbi:hypothetical protein ACFQJD_14060 [Haloplanus sp. GCM10025708]|uniref:hypothetical protein n=1 Tax=Haloplanus sp. GCM10025708 TaxID=3252679 RepID=UPI0036159926
MIQLSGERRAAMLAVLVVLSAVAFSATAAAAPETESSLTVDPTAVASNSTNSHSFAVNVTTTVDGANDRLEITFPDAFALSGPSATLTTNDSANLSKGTVQVVDRTGDSAAETLEVVVVDSGAGGASASVNLTGSVSAAAPTGEFSGTVRSGYDVGDDGSATTDLDAGSRSLSTYTYAPSYDTAASSGTVYPGATVYLGQGDVTFGGGLGTRLLGVAGDADGRVLQSPILRDQPVGRYSSDGSASARSVTVDTPRITTFRVENANAEDVSGGAVSAGSAGQLRVVVDYNFANAEDVELTVEDPSRLDVTDDVLTGPATFNGAHSVGLDLSDGKVGFYTISVEGSDDLDFGEANRSTSIGFLPDRSPSIHVDTDTAVQGATSSTTSPGAAPGPSTSSASTRATSARTPRSRSRPRSSGTRATWSNAASSPPGRGHTGGPSRPRRGRRRVSKAVPRPPTSPPRTPSSKSTTTRGWPSARSKPNISTPRRWRSTCPTAS